LVQFLARARNIGVYFLQSGCGAYLALFSMGPTGATEVKWLGLQADDCNLLQRLRMSELETSLLHISS